MHYNSGVSAEDPKLYGHIIEGVNRLIRRETQPERDEHIGQFIEDVLVPAVDTQVEVSPEWCRDSLKYYRRIHPGLGNDFNFHDIAPVVDRMRREFDAIKPPESQELNPYIQIMQIVKYCNQFSPS